MHTNTVHQRILGHLRANPSCASAAQIYLTWQNGCWAPASALLGQPCVAHAPTDGMKVMGLMVRAGRWAWKRGCPAGMQELPRVWEMEARSNV